jgi:hypothetical protein
VHGCIGTWYAGEWAIRKIWMFGLVGKRASGREGGRKGCEWHPHKVLHSREGGRKGCEWRPHKVLHSREGGREGCEWHPHKVLHPRQGRTLHHDGCDFLSFTTELALQVKPHLSYLVYTASHRVESRRIASRRALYRVTSYRIAYQTVVGVLLSYHQLAHPNMGEWTGG